MRVLVIAHDGNREMMSEKRKKSNKKKTERSRKKRTMKGIKEMGAEFQYDRKPRVESIKEGLQKEKKQKEAKTMCWFCVRVWMGTSIVCAFGILFPTASISPRFC